MKNSFTLCGYLNGCADMKQLTFYILLFITAFSSTHLLAGEKIVFWNGHQHAEYMAKLVDEFQKKTGIEVELHQFLSSQLRDEVLTQANTNELPDLLYIPGDFVGLYKEINLTPVPEDWMSSQLDVRVRDAGKIEDINYGIPLFQGNHLMLFYNRDFVNKAIQDWDQLQAQRVDFPADMKYPFTWNYREMYWLIPFMSAFDSWPIEEDKITLNMPAMVDALNFYKTLADAGFVDTECDHNCGVDRFKAGQSAYMINGDWVIRDLEKSMGDKLGIAMLPKIKGKAMIPMFSSYILAYPHLAKGSKKFELLKQFSLFAQSKFAQEIIRDQGGLMPVSNEVLKQQTKAKTENELAIMKQMLATKPMPTSNKMAIAWSAMTKGFTRFMDHNYPAEKTVILMQRVADKELKRRNKAEEK